MTHLIRKLLLVIVWIVAIVGIFLLSKLVNIWLFIACVWVILLQIQVLGLQKQIVDNNAAPNISEVRLLELYGVAELAESVGLEAVSAIEFSSAPLSIQQIQMYHLLKLESFPANDRYITTLAFLHARAVDKSTKFRNLPPEIVKSLTERAFNTASSQEFENLGTIFDETSK